MTTALRILIVEDNADYALVLSMLLKCAGHRVKIAKRGDEAIAVAQAEVHDVVILDIGLPDVSGYEVARRLNQDVRTRPRVIVAVTGYGDEEHRRRSAEAGIDLHLVKPISMAELAAKLSECELTNNSIGPGNMS